MRLYIPLGNEVDAEQDEGERFWNFQLKCSDALLAPSTCQRVHKHNKSTMALTP